MRALLGGLLSIFGGIYALISLGAVIGNRPYGPAQAHVAPALGCPPDLLATALALLAVVAGVWLLRGSCVGLPQRRR